MKKTNTNFKREFSAGCVVYKRPKGNKVLRFKFLLGKHSGYHKWVLPKGLIEKGERGWQTALRETEEEMGIKAKLIFDKPIHVEKYFYYADFKNIKEIKKLRNEEIKGGVRRVMTYQESFDKTQDEWKKIKVFKTVSFYLAEFDSGDPKNHGWEMSEAGWFDYDKALKLLAFKGEKEALQKGKKLADCVRRSPLRRTKAEEVGFEPTRACARALSKRVE